MNERTNDSYKFDFVPILNWKLIRVEIIADIIRT